MKRNGIIELVLTIAAGVAGYLLRSRELGTIFDETTGLAQKNAPVSLMLIGLSVLICLVLLVMTVGLRRKSDVDFAAAFAYSNSIPNLLIFILSVLMAIFAGYWLMVNPSDQGSAFKDMLWGVLTVLSGAAMAATALKIIKGRVESTTAMLTMVPVVYLCVWLVISYMDRAADPVMLRYIYEFFALAFTLMAYYYIASFAFDKIRIRRLVFCSRVAVYFILVTVAGDLPSVKSAVYICLGAILLLRAWLATRNAVRHSGALGGGNAEEQNPYDSQADYDADWSDDIKRMLGDEGIDPVIDFDGESQQY